MKNPSLNEWRGACKVAKTLHKLSIIYIFCSDYYSGMNSRGYRIMCRISKKLNGILGKDWYWEFIEGNEDKLRMSKLYKHLTEKFSNSV